MNGTCPATSPFGNHLTCPSVIFHECGAALSVAGQRPLNPGNKAIVQEPAVSRTGLIQEIDNT
jgi:hypothetical protein